ncbi:MAG: integrase [Candidatus Acidiferrum sp.]
MARPVRHDGVVFRRRGTNYWWMRYRERDGSLRKESTLTKDWHEAQKKLRERLQARDGNFLNIVRRGENLNFGQWADFFLENYSKPPVRELKTHEANLRAAKHLNLAFATRRLIDVTADDIELFLRERLRQRVKTMTSNGYHLRGTVKPSTVHQDLRVLRRILNVAVRKRLLPSNPCSGVEFPVLLKTMFRPHYVTWSEQQRIERYSPQYLRNVVRIIAETGLRVKKELLSMRQEQIDLANATVWIPDSKTPNGVAEVPLTPIAMDAFRSQISLAGPGDYLFPNAKSMHAHQKSLKKVWRTTLKKAGIPYFRIYDLRSTYATRLSAGGVADEWVTQLLRQGDSQVFKKYSQMKLTMKREALRKLNRLANEMTVGEAKPVPEAGGFGTVLEQSGPKSEGVDFGIGRNALE